MRGAGPGDGRDGHHRARRAARAWCWWPRPRRGRPAARPRSRAPRRSDASASSRPARPPPSLAVEAIERADLILIGPGSLFTSVLAACVVPGITQALAGTRATKIYVANLRAEIPETEGFTLQDHVDALRASRRRTPTSCWSTSARRFADDPCTVATRVRDLSGRNGLVHDVQKLAAAVLRRSAKLLDRRQEETQWQHGSQSTDSDVSDAVSCAPP